MKGWRAKAILILISLVVSLVAAEFLLRWALPGGDRFYVWPPGYKFSFRPDPKIYPGSSPQVNFTINSAGIRGDEFRRDQTYRILVVGGSTAECFNLALEATWPYLVQTILRRKTGRKIWVGNIGLSGLNTRDHVLQMKFLKNPRINAAIFLIGINDLSLRLMRDVRYDPKFAENPAGMKHQVQHAFKVRPRSWEPFPKNLALYQVLRRIKHKLFPPKKATQDLTTQWRRHRAQAKVFRPKLPDMKSALAEYARNIKRLIALCRARGIRPIFLTQPTMWKDKMSPAEVRLLWLGGVGEYQAKPGSDYYSTGALARGMEMYNRTLTKICRAQGVECLDVAGLIKKNLTNFCDACHYTVAGSLVLARAVADYLASRPPFARVRTRSPRRP
jgi:hypothetical protein